MQSDLTPRAAVASWVVPRTRLGLKLDMDLVELTLGLLVHPHRWHPDKMCGELQEFLGTSAHVRHEFVPCGVWCVGAHESGKTKQVYGE